LQGIFAAATNNVIWSLATGENHSHDDPQTIHLTKSLAKHFSQFSTSDPQLVLMLNSPLYTRLRKALGFTYAGGFLFDIRKKINAAINLNSPDTKGNYIERSLAEMEKEEKSAFIKRIGKQQLAAQLIDLFAAGKH